MKTPTLVFVLCAITCAGLACTKSAPADAPTDEAPAAHTAGDPESTTTAEAQPAPPRGNLLQNPSFEDGRASWSWKNKSQFWVDFEIEEEKSHSGTRSVKLELDSGDGSKLSSRVAAVFQEVTVPEFPERLGGYYYVEELGKSDPRIELFLQVTVIVWGEEKNSLPNYQIRYYLGGQTHVSAPIGNAKIEVLTGEQPKTNTWVPFDIPIRDDFKRLWGAVPQAYDRVEVFFEVRWDKMTKQGEVVAEVIYDDLYVEPFQAP
ncbi:MAG: hypothetical protein AAGF92_22790 [Myxococcota bacterium]